MMNEYEISDCHTKLLPCPFCGNALNKPSNYCSECGQCLVKCI